MPLHVIWKMSPRDNTRVTCNRFTTALNDIWSPERITTNLQRTYNWKRIQLQVGSSRSKSTSSTIVLTVKPVVEVVDLNGQCRRVITSIHLWPLVSNIGVTYDLPTNSRVTAMLAIFTRTSIPSPSGIRYKSNHNKSQRGAWTLCIDKV